MVRPVGHARRRRPDRIRQGVGRAAGTERVPRQRHPRRDRERRGDIASTGSLGHDQPFRIGIPDPFSPRRLAEVVHLTGAIATSGTYERGNHLIDPHSGRPLARSASASVTGPDLGLADALATALAVAGSPGLDMIEAVEGYEALVIALDAAVTGRSISVCPARRGQNVIRAVQPRPAAPVRCS